MADALTKTELEEARLRTNFKRRLRYLWNKVAKAEGLHSDFTLELREGGEGWVYCSTREAVVGIDGDKPERLLLHEMAHALLRPQRGNGHTIKWYLLYTRLLVQYLWPESPDDGDLVAFGVNMDWL